VRGVVTRLKGDDMAKRTISYKGLLDKIFTKYPKVRLDKNVVMLSSGDLETATYTHKALRLAISDASRLLGCDKRFFILKRVVSAYDVAWVMGFGEDVLDRFADDLYNVYVEVPASFNVITVRFIFVAS
jgi:hypothetical protein